MVNDYPEPGPVTSAIRAVVYDAVGAVPTVRRVPAPACPPDGVVVDVGATGVCRSDWHGWRGHDPVPLPHTPGHEWAGVVAEVGSEQGCSAANQKRQVPEASEEAYIE